MKHIGKLEEKDNDMGLIFASIAGAIVGAGVAVVATVAMKDEKTKKNIQDISISFYEKFKEQFRKSNSTKSNTTKSKPRKKTVKKLGNGKK